MSLERDVNNIVIFPILIQYKFRSYYGYVEEKIYNVFIAKNDKINMILFKKLLSEGVFTKHIHETMKYKPIVSIKIDV